jgi:DNA uptake protein ComE-like DNA-binding protein
MWKDWFFFSKSQRIGIIVLMSIILVLIGIKIAIPYFASPKATVQDDFVQRAQAFTASLKHQQINKYNADPHSEKHYSSLYPHYTQQTLPAPVLSRFNPNTLDSAGFVKLGIKPRIASNILKYRAKGGKFKKTDDFGKIWGISSEQMKLLLSYIDIPAEPVLQSTIDNRSKNKKTDGIVELNSADTTQLQQIRGIGSGFAKRIAGYRKRLGGYVAIEQLREIYGMTPELYSQIAPHFTINSQLIHKIEVNKASVERLKSHPYLNFYKAKAIFERRLTKGKLKNSNDLRGIDELDDATLNKIMPYLTFE